MASLLHCLKHQKRWGRRARRAHRGVRRGTRRVGWGRWREGLCPTLKLTQALVVVLVEVFHADGVRGVGARHVQDLEDVHASRPVLVEVDILVVAGASLGLTLCCGRRVQALGAALLDCMLVILALHRREADKPVVVVLEFHVNEHVRKLALRDVKVGGPRGRRLVRVRLVGAGMGRARLRIATSEHLEAHKVSALHVPTLVLLLGVEYVASLGVVGARKEHALHAGQGLGRLIVGTLVARHLCNHYAQNMITAREYRVSPLLERVECCLALESMPGPAPPNYKRTKSI